MTHPTQTAANNSKPQYVTDLEQAYGAPSQQAFGSAVFYEQLPASADLEQAALAHYRFFVGELHLEPWQILVLIQLSFLIMGMFLDDTAMLVIVAPLYVSLVDALGYSLIWYGVLYTITCQIAYLTPPFGYNLFLMRAMAPKDYTLPMIYRSVVPWVLLMLLTLLIVMIFPQIALYLPELVYS